VPGQPLLGRRRHGIEQCQRIRRTLLLQQHRREIDAQFARVRVARQRRAQHRLGLLAGAGQMQERREVADGGAMRRHGRQGTTHRGRRALEVAVSILDKAQIDPGIGECRRGREHAAKCRLGRPKLPPGQMRHAAHIERLRRPRRTAFRLVRRGERRAGIAERQRRRRQIHRRRGILGQQRHAGAEQRRRLRVPPGLVQRQAEMQVRIGIIRRGGAGTLEQRDRLVPISQPESTQAKQPQRGCILRRPRQQPENTAAASP